MQAPNVQTFIIDDEASWKDLRELVGSSSYEYLVLDLETNNKSEKKADIYGIGLCFEDNTAFYIPIRNNKQQLVWSEEVVEDIYQWITIWSHNHKLIGWNIIYDVLVWENNSGKDISNCIYADGILAKHLVDEERPFGLKECSVRYLGPWADKAQKAMLENIQKNGGQTTKENMDMWLCDTEILGEYCCWDVLLTWKLTHFFLDKINTEGMESLYFEETMPLYKKCTIPMKRRGFPIDVEHFKRLKVNITKEIETLENAIMEEINPAIDEYVTTLLNDNYPVAKTGNFVKAAAQYFDTALPITPEGKVTTAKKAVEKEAQRLFEKYEWNNPLYTWMLGQRELSTLEVKEIQIICFKTDIPDRKSIFNLKSSDHLGWLLFTHLGEKPASFTEKTNKPQIDDDYLESIKNKYKWVERLVDYKKLNKLSSTYIDGMLDRHINGVIYASLLQFGTTSGRYSSTDPNLQNIPREKDEDANLSPLVLKYANAIKEGFIAPKGFKIVNADYSALEPRCFAHASGDERLRDVFRKGLDLYSQIAIDVWNLHECSANPKDNNYLKNKYPEKRQLAKVFVLAVVYGAEAGRISQAMGISYQEAQDIIDNYLDAYPELRKYMEKCDFLSTKYGMVKTEFGRVRHLPQAKRIYDQYGDKLLNKKWAKSKGLDDVRYTLKNALNNSKNFPIQGIAGHIVNRAMIRTVELFEERSINAWLVVMVHDEITCISEEKDAKRASDALKEAMETTTKISIPLKAEPKIANNWKEAK